MGKYEAASSHIVDSKLFVGLHTRSDALYGWSMAYAIQTFKYNIADFRKNLYKNCMKRKKPISNKSQPPDESRKMYCFDLFQQSRRDRYEEAAEAADGLGLAEWIRRVLDAAADEQLKK